MDPVGGGPELLGVPVEFFLFALTLAGVALFHRHTLRVALGGLATITAYKLIFADFGRAHEPGALGLLHHLGHEWVILANLLGLLLGFALLADAFERSRVPDLLPRILPDGWTGGLALLALVFALSGFLDNIAAAMIGGTIARAVFQGRVHLGYLAAIVAASNAGGAGSVVGDTTTTMMWLAGRSPLDVVHAYIAAFPALLIFGVIAARQQHAHQPIQADPAAGVRIDWGQLVVVFAILGLAIVVNVSANLAMPDELSGALPWLGLAVWTAILATARLRRPDWGLLPEALKGSIFLLSLVLCASMMPVEELPPPSWVSALSLGFISAVFDNIPLTALALNQGGYDWGVLAFCVGFGGSMTWFGSSAGVAISNLYPQARSVGAWLRAGWHVPLGYVVGFFVLLALWGWRPPDAPQGSRPPPPAPEATGSR